MSGPLYYLEVETSGLETNHEFTIVSKDMDELIADYLKWAHDNQIDMEHTSKSDIRRGDNDLLVAYLEQTDDFSSVIVHPITHTLVERIARKLGREI